MTMRYETKYKFGEPAVYEFDVKLRHLRGVNITDGQLEGEVESALDAFADYLRGRYKWIGNVYLTGRSGGWLAVEDDDGKARQSTLHTIDKLVSEAVRKFQKDLRESYGEQE